VQALGARYLSTREVPLVEAAETYGPFDVVFEATGASFVAFEAMEALAAYFYLTPLGSTTTSSLSDVVPESAPAARAQSQAEDLSGPVEAPAILVYSNLEGFTELDLGRIRGGVRRLNEGPGQPYRLQRAVPLAA
jgi:hypothetical protein